jgi:hypothetical protein
MFVQKTVRSVTRVAGARGMAGGARAAFSWRDPLLLDEQLTDEEAMIQVRRVGSLSRRTAIDRTSVD